MTNRLFVTVHECLWIVIPAWPKHKHGHTILTCMAALAFLTLALLAQEPTRLEIGHRLEGVVSEGAPEVHTPTLDSYHGTVPASGVPFQVIVTESGPYIIELRSFDFDAYLVLLDPYGALLAEDDDGLVVSHARLAMHLQADLEYRVQACALRGSRGEFQLELRPGVPIELSREDRERAEIDDWKARSLYIEATIGTETAEYATALTWLGNFNIRDGAISQAHQQLGQALAIYQRLLGPEHPAVAVAENNLADTLMLQGAYAEALPLYERSLAIREKVVGPDHLDTADSLTNISACFQHQGFFEQAQPLLERALAIFEKAVGPEHPRTAASLGNLAVIFHALGNLEEASALAGRSLAIREMAFGSEHLAMAYSHNEVGSLLQSQGNYEQARVHFERALEIRKKTLAPDHRDIAISLNNLALLLQDLGNFEEAKLMLEGSLAIREKVFGTYHLDTARSLNNLAALLLLQGNLEDARPMFEKTLEIREQLIGPDHPETADVLNNLAYLFDSEGNFEKALPLYERSLAISAKALGPEHPETIVSINNLAVLFQHQGRFERAEPLAVQALQISARVFGAEHPQTATCLNNLANILFNLGRYEEARPLYERGIQISLLTLDADHPQTAKAIKNQANFFEAQGDFKSAQPLRVEAASRMLHHLDIELPTMTEAQRFRYLNKLANPEKLLANLCFDNPDSLGDMYSLFLKWKGKATRLQAAGLRLINEGDSEWLRKSRGEIQMATKKIADLLYLPEKDQESNHFNRIASLRKKRLEMEIGINRRLKLDSILSSPPFEEIQRALPVDSVLLDFFVGQGIFAWIVKADEDPVLLYLGDSQAIPRAHQILLNSTASRGGRTSKDSDEGSGNLLELVWGPLQTAVGSATSVIISPDGFLNELPFGILKDHDGIYLLEKFRFHYVSDATQLVGRSEFKGAAEGSILAVGNVDYLNRDKLTEQLGSQYRSRIGIVRPWPMLAGTTEELQSLQEIHDQVVKWNSPLILLSGKSATEESVTKEIPGKRYIHLATHGFFEPDSLPSLGAVLEDGNANGVLGEQKRAVGLFPGLLSGLVFAGVNEDPDPTRDDGYLSAEEVQRIDLTECDLAVLSACQTALGSTRAGEGLMSLRRAFEVAGAKTVISSLWKVDDAATSTLMRRFYLNLWQLGMTKGEALHQAKLWLLHKNKSASKGEDSNPNNWGAFVLSGDWN